MSQPDRYSKIISVYDDLKGLHGFRQNPVSWPSEGSGLRASPELVLRLAGSQSDEDISTLLNTAGDLYAKSRVPIRLEAHGCRFGIPKCDGLAEDSSTLQHDDKALEFTLTRRHMLWKTGWDILTGDRNETLASLQPQVDAYRAFIEQFDLRIQLYLKEDLEYMLSLLQSLQFWKQGDYGTALAHAEQAIALRPQLVGARAAASAIREDMDTQSRQSKFGQGRILPNY